MELTLLLLTGSLSGLVSVLVHSIAYSSIEFLRPRFAAAAGAALQISVAEAALHMVAGIGLGFLFWLSWGLAAVVDVSWWVRGLSFGILCCLALALPAVVSMAIVPQGVLSVAVAIAARWMTTCTLAGLACAWRWQSTM